MKFVSPMLAFSAPSGAGKTTIVRHLADKYEQMVISVSATTRDKRPGEKNGVDYFFMTEREFSEAIKEGLFLEYEQVHGRYYGTLRSTVEEYVRKGKTVLFDIDVNGALAIKKNYPRALLFFIKPPGREELVRRLQGRKSETESSIKKRLERLEYEYQQAGHFDYTVVNDRLEETIEQIEQIILKK